MKLIDWIVRHDLLGEGSLMKTIHLRGTGYDRPGDYDEICLSAKLYQKNDEGEETVFVNVEEQEMAMTDQDLVTPVVRKILGSMKHGEVTSTVVTPEYVQKMDPAFGDRYSGFNASKELHVDLNLLSLGKIEDLYHD